MENKQKIMRPESRVWNSWNYCKLFDLIWCKAQPPWYGAVSPPVEQSPTVFIFPYSRTLSHSASHLQPFEHHSRAFVNTESRTILRLPEFNQGTVERLTSGLAESFNLLRRFLTCRRILPDTWFS